MNIIPEIKKIEKASGVCSAESFAWQFDEGVDERVIRAAKRICDSGTGTPVYVDHENDGDEGYTLCVENDGIKIFGKSAAGAFYALMTLKMLAKASDGKIECCDISDAPDFPYRGFYQDTTRGRIPTLDTLKKLADTMAEYKLNSLQLYVEHSYEFKEYEFCRDQLGCLTKAEIQELDAYCRERFIELIPSLSSFGHLYHLLQSEQYKHLCELKDYTPTRHHYMERMAHHTINPLLDESFELVKSLMDQHMEAFTSDKFNICCDETFDLGRDVNQGHDKGELYINFVKKLVAYLESKGKTVMMWGDIALQHPERLSEFPESLTFLNWYYDADAPENRFEALANKKQIVCPGTSAWCGFHERVDIEEINITKLARYGKKYGALGVLNTNWGNIGNPASVDMAMYGLILGAACAWCADAEPTEEFKQFISDCHYGCSEAMDILTTLSRACTHANWLTYNWDWLHYADNSQSGFEGSQAVIKSIIEQIKKADFKDSKLKNEFLLAAEGDSLLCEWSAANEGFSAPSDIDFSEWSERYKKNWLDDSKRGELYELISVFTRVNEKAKGEETK